MISFPGILLRLCVALFLGALIGLERESRDHSAGLRTNALVALGAALFTVISAYGFRDLIGQTHVQLDPTRIASYVIAGIGFLGGGAIYHQQTTQKVKGLTTAASVWIVAALGMACGAGLLLEAVVTTVLALFILVGMRYVERVLRPPTREHIHLVRVTLAPDSGGLIIGQIYDLCVKSNVVVETVEIHAEDEYSKIKGETINITCYTRENASLMQLVSEVRTLPGVRSVDAALRKIVLPVE